jgi:hypothetical protein
MIRAPSAEDARRRVALFLSCTESGPAPRRSAGDAVLLADAGFVSEPDLYRIKVKDLLARDACQCCGDVL